MKLHALSISRWKHEVRRLISSALPVALHLRAHSFK